MQELGHAPIPLLPKSPEAMPITHGSTLHCGVGTQSPTCTSVELGPPSGLALPTDVQ